MAYNPWNAANGILNLKSEWETADEKRRKELENRAKQLYGDLESNGYGNIANQLHNSNYGQAQGVVQNLKNSQAKAGATQVRPYVTSILKGLYGMTDAEANSASAGTRAMAI